ncbi:MAG: hypothetical protein ACYDD7_06690 [Acidimicrobiales bacterium]
MVLAVAASLSACSHGAGRSIATLHASGDVLEGGRRVTGTNPVHAGDTIIVNGGTAGLGLPGGARIELRAGSAVRIAAGIELIGGDMLAQSASASSPLRISTAIAEVAVQGTSRLRRDLALTVGTYAGEATISSGRTVVLPALSQDTIPSVSILPLPSPLHLDATDSWDQRMLGTAIEVTNQIDSQSRFIDANVPAAVAASSAFYVSDLQALRKTPTFDDALLQSATGSGRVPPAGEGVAAAAIALSGPGDFTSRWRAVFALRAAGAQWGIIVLEEDANPAQVLSLIDSAVDNANATPVVSSPALIAAAKPATTPTPTATATSKPVPVGVARSSTRPRPTTKPAPGPGTPPPPATTVTPPDTVLLGPVLNPIVDPLGHLLNGLLGSH